MLISIITPTFNSEKTIERNARSIVNQSYKHFEHIIVDNDSKDNTINIINKVYGGYNLLQNLTVISEKDEGISEAFNKGIKKSAGDIIGILNSDDEYFNETVFERVAKAFGDSRILFTHGNIFFNDIKYGSNIRKPLLCPVNTAMPYNHPSMFFRKEIYEKYGLFDESYKYAMDYALVINYEKNIPDFRSRGKYIHGDPIAVMNSGGASWSNELGSITESKEALQKFGFWNKEAARAYSVRKFRTVMKKYLSILGFNFIVKIWRNLKWKNND